MDNPNKLVFLDCDGVINSSAFYKKSEQYRYEKETIGMDARPYDLKKLDILRYIHDKTNCTFVMSSTWRSFYFCENLMSRVSKGCRDLKKDLAERGIEIRYKTSNNYDKEEFDRQSKFDWKQDDKGLYYTAGSNEHERPTLTKFYERGYQINEFLTDWKKQYPKTSFVVLDDDEGDLILFKENFVKTNWYGEDEDECGITYPLAEKAIQILNRE